MNPLEADFYPEYIYLYKTTFRTSQRTLSISMTNTSRFVLCILRNSQNVHLIALFG